MSTTVPGRRSPHIPDETRRGLVRAVSEYPGMNGEWLVVHAAIPANQGHLLKQMESEGLIRWGLPPHIHPATSMLRDYGWMVTDAGMEFLGL